MTHYVIEVEKETRRSRNVNKSRKIKRLKVAPSHHMWVHALITWRERSANALDESDRNRKNSFHWRTRASNMSIRESSVETRAPQTQRHPMPCQSPVDMRLPRADKLLNLRRPHQRARECNLNCLPNWGSLTRVKQRMCVLTNPPNPLKDLNPSSRSLRSQRQNPTWVLLVLLPAKWAALARHKSKSHCCSSTSILTTRTCIDWPSMKVTHPRASPNGSASNTVPA